MTAQTHTLILSFQSWIRILTKSRDEQPCNLERVRFHNKFIRMARREIKELEAK